MLEQFEKGKISIELQGKKLRGKFSLVRTRRENQWLLIKSSDQFASIGTNITLDAPQSVLSGRDDIPTGASKSFMKVTSSSERSELTSSKSRTKVSHRRALKRSEYLPSKKIKPMLARAIDKPFNNKEWVFEVKWDGVRAILLSEMT